MRLFVCCHVKKTNSSVYCFVIFDFVEHQDIQSGGKLQPTTSLVTHPIMFVEPSTLQVLLAIVLMLLGLCGNLVVPFVSYRTTLRGPHITVLAALDFTATLLGPGLRS